MSKRMVGAGLTAASLLTAAPTLAHIELLAPEPRAYGRSEGNLKTQPCGQSANGRTDRVTVYRPGETIEVVWNEYINHTSYFRIAFEVDGDDFVQRPPENLSAASDDAITEENAIDIGQLLAIVEDTGTGEHRATVTLPDQECENCTLQLIQFMYGRSDSYYYQCADLALRNDDGTGAGGSGNLGGAGGIGGGGATTGGVLVGGTGGSLTTGGTGGAFADGGTGGTSPAGSTGGVLAAGGTGGAFAVGGTGGMVVAGGTGGMVAAGGTGSMDAAGGTGSMVGAGGMAALGGTEATDAGSPLATGGAGPGVGGTSLGTGGTGGEFVDPDGTSRTSASDDDGSCSAAGPAPSRTAGFGFALWLGLVLTWRHRRTRR
jgi:hypothetical protein